MLIQPVVRSCVVSAQVIRSNVECNSLFSVQSQGTEEQKAKWLPLAKDFKIFGAYAQTELGHGKCVSTLYMLSQTNRQTTPRLTLYICHKQTNNTMPIHYVCL